MNNFSVNSYGSSQSLYTRQKQASGVKFDGADFTEQLNERLPNIKNQTLKLSNEQKEYLKGKYNISQMTFPINGTSSRATDEFMQDLYKMGLISEKELKSYTTPTRYMRRPDNYDSLPENIKKGIVDDPLVSQANGTTYESYILTKNVAGENIKDAFKYLAIQQKRQAELSVSEESRSYFTSYSDMYVKLSEIVEEVFG